MSDFSFSATAECDKCGAYLSSSDEDCDHDGASVDKHVFRRIGEGRKSLKAVEATARHKWYVLASGIGDDWIAYEYLGTIDTVNSMLRGSTWDSVEDLPKQTMSLDAPRDIGGKD